jgi:SAM-dependent methyltransferase
MKRRTTLQKLKDGLSFPLRALTIPEQDRWGLSSWVTERFDYAAREVRGYCLDVGCGVRNRFVSEFLDGHGKGIDVHTYEGLDPGDVITDIGRFPFPDQTFDTVTFIAMVNHVPEDLRPVELREARRVLRPGGNVVVTMGNPLLEIGAHGLLDLRSRFLGDRDVYHDHGAEEDDIYFLTDTAIKALLTSAGFRNVRKKSFWTQWGLNHLLSADRS